MSMDKYERVPESKTEIDGVIDALCSDYDCQIRYLPSHLDDGKPGGSDQYYQLVKLTSKPLHINYETVSI